MFIYVIYAQLDSLGLPQKGKDRKMRYKKIHLDLGREISDLNKGENNNKLK